MKLADSLTRAPRAYERDRGTDAAALVSHLGPEIETLVLGAASTSPYLAGLIAKEADWLEQGVADPDAAVVGEFDAIRQEPHAGLGNRLRQAKRRIALLTALADLGGAWPLHKVTGTLSDFADLACSTALQAALLVQIKRGKLPTMDEQDAATGAGMVVLAMGKMGAGELNYSSDIDLICLFDETRFAPDDFHDARAAFIRATRMMSATLSELTAQGYVFRTDLRLRPDPAVTPVCMAMEAAERYYESLGRTWERAAYIKARVAAGEQDAGARFLKTLTPFVWRKHLDFAAIQDAHDMRLAIRQHKGLGGPISLSGHNMKLGRGGIREIEFFTQTRQLIAGGRDKDLRCRGTVEGLSVLAQKGWIAHEAAAELTEHYTAHRTVEHRLQMVNDAQTHNLPSSQEGFARLAAMMDADEDDLRADLRARLEAVHSLTEGFFAPSKTEPATSAGLDDETLARWLSYPALRSERSREIFARLCPDLMVRLSDAARPDEALRAFDGFLAGLPAGVQLFSLLEANPQLSDLLIDITGTSEALGQYLSRNAGVIDAVIGGDFFTQWPGADGLVASLQDALHNESDYETCLDMTRRWSKEWHFRIGVHLLRGLSTPKEAGQQYADLARAVVRAIWPLVTNHFARRHGPPPGRGAVVLGMGSLGAGQLNTGSDLDLIVIYDPEQQETSQGPKPLPTRPYYARLTQALITALTAPMAQGRLYEVDMRLRPSGNQGPVATSLPAFKSYQQEQAWVWEHLALTRAAVIAGPKDLTDDVSDFIAQLLQNGRPISEVAGDVADMRARIQAAKTPNSPWDIKIGSGRLQDIELIEQAGALICGHPTSATGLRDAVSCELLTPEACSVLEKAKEFMTQVHLALRLLSDKAPAIDALGTSGRAFVLRTAKASSMEALQERLEQSYTECGGAIDAALAPFHRGDTR